MLLKRASLPQYKRLFEAMQTQLKCVCGAGIVVALGHCVDKPEGLRLSYESACRLMERKFIFGCSSVMMEERPADGAMPKDARAGPG